MTDDEDKYPEFFCPHLWRQRRMFIKDVLARFKIETVLDYGCGEAAVLSYLIPQSEDNKITKMAGIDIWQEVLEEAIDRCTPWQTDFDQLRDHPLLINIYKGSIGVPDDRFKGYRGIVCTEVIEHVYSDVLDSFLSITLGIYKPEILIVTTPNAEYNVYFPDLKYGTNESEFRHDDHKFEWTRKEFETWCNAGAEKYGYDVEYHGIGLLHGKYDEVENGHCTQACIFIHRSDTPTVEETPTSHGNPHKLLKHIEFPYFNEPPPPKEKIIEELMHYIQMLCVSETYAKEKPAFSYHESSNKREEKEEGDQINLDLATDWSTFNLEETLPNVNNNIPLIIEEISKKPKHTIIPLNLPVSSLWNILRIRQICETMDTMLRLLSLLDNDEYKLLNDEFIQVKKAFEIDDDDNNSAKTFSSLGSW